LRVFVFDGELSRKHVKTPVRLRCSTAAVCPGFSCSFARNDHLPSAFRVPDCIKRLPISGRRDESGIVHINNIHGEALTK